MTTDKPLGIGFFGAGDVSDLHATGVDRCADTQLIGLWNRTAQTGRAKAESFGCCTYDTPQQLLADP
ncbi:MAG: gfo/Idh/MocA family oxidoreductase, partial [Candidatus Latescibacterota bacterium]|nr:gfo/Idh/MocA family oxidoreductase [Candidatus Latescibacterota bacterium]